MKRKWRSLSMALILAVLVFEPVAVNPPPVEAAWNGVVMAGRVLRSVNPDTSGCRATAYGRVDGNLVLFLANHCKQFGEQFGNDMPFGPAYTDGGVQIGWWGNGTTIACNCPNSWEDNDLTYITLDVNSVWYPTSGRNRIYRGDVTGNGLTSDDYRNMTTQPTASDGCSSYPIGGTWLDDNVYQMWQQTMTTTYTNRVGTPTQKTSVNDGCLISSNLSVHGSCCDSASPWVGSWDTTTLHGLATDAPGGLLRYNSFFEGLFDLDAYFDTHSNHTGAKLCITSSC
jgi:hypothetical protein